MIDLSYHKPAEPRHAEPEEIVMGVIVIALVIAFGWFLGAAL